MKGIIAVIVIGIIIMVLLLKMIKDKNAIVRVTGYLITIAILMMVLNVVLNYFFNLKLF